MHSRPFLNAVVVSQSHIPKSDKTYYMKQAGTQHKKTFHINGEKERDAIMSQGTSAFIIAGMIVASMLAGAGLGLAFSGAKTTNTQTSGVNSSTPYVLTMMITTNNYFNSTTGNQPVFYVLGYSGLKSSANITLPANQLIELVITNYDDGNASLVAPNYANVTGTISGSETVFNNANVNSTISSSGIVLRGSQILSYMSSSVISHTFTVPSLNLNLPIATQSTIVALFNTGAPGKFNWMCAATCGSGSQGTAGAMATSGWMKGVFTVS